MFKVNIDQKEIKIDDSSLKNFGELMDKISEKFLKNKIITKVRLNKKSLNLEELKDYSLKTDEIKFLEIETDNLKNMKEKGLFLLKEYVSKLIPQMEKSSELLRIEDELEANEHFAICIEDLRLLINLIESFGSVLHFDFNEVSFYDLPKNPAERLLSIIKEIVVSQENNDWIMLADLIEYELIPILKEWAQIIEFIQKKYIKPTQ